MGSVPSCACIFFFNTNSELLPSKNPELMQCRPCCKPGHRCVRFLDLEQAGTCTDWSVTDWRILYPF